MKKIFWCFFIFIVSTQILYAFERKEKQKLVGIPQELNTIKIHVLKPLKNIDKGFTQKLIGYIKIWNNNPSGFILSLSSKNASKMVRENSNKSIYGNYLPYTLTIQKTSKGVLGADTFNNLDSLTLKKKSLKIKFTDPLKPTVAARINLRVTASSRELFSGTYEDTIIINIANI